jgi:LL-diaminopimelate aminotransferase
MLSNAQILKEGLSHAGLQIYGGEHAPYLWIRIPERTTAWKFFEQLLYEAQTIVTPGTGFGPEGENYIRLSTFAKNSGDSNSNAVRAIKKSATGFKTFLYISYLINL